MVLKCKFIFLLVEFSLSYLQLPRCENAKMQDTDQLPGNSLLVCEFASAIVKGPREMFLVRGVLLLRHSLKCKWRLLTLGLSIVALPCHMCITVLSVSVFSVGNEDLVS